MITIKGYITNLGKYNEGYLIGEWITFPINEYDLSEVLSRIGINEEYEEYFFTDWDCNIDFDFGEYVSIDEINDIAEECDMLNEYDAKKLDAIICSGENAEYALRNMDEYIFHDGATMRDIAEDYVEMSKTKDIPDMFINYFDYDAYIRDLKYEGIFIEAGTGILELL